MENCLSMRKFHNCVNDSIIPKLEVIETLKYKSNLHKKKDRKLQPI